MMDQLLNSKDKPNDKSIVESIDELKSEPRKAHKKYYNSCFNFKIV